MIKKKILTPLILSGIFVLMLGLSFAAVPLYDLFCRVTGFGGTTQISNEAPKIVLDETINVRLDTNVHSQFFGHQCLCRYIVLVDFCLDSELLLGDTKAH